MAKTKLKKPKAVTSCDMVWDAKINALLMAQSSLWLARRALTRAEVWHRQGERELATIALVMHRAGDERVRPWLVCWWNNFQTSPRGLGPCINEASEIPTDAAPLEESDHDR